MAGKTRNIALLMLNTLMMSDRPMTTTELCEAIGCERKSIYISADTLEISGFGIIKDTEATGRGGKLQSTYQFNGIYGFSER